MVLLGAAQVAVFLVLGQFLFRVNLGSELPRIALTLLIYSWLCASLGVLIGSVIAAEERIVGLCLLVSLVMAALGGCWWPLEVVPETIQTLAHLFPTAWALDALHQMITFGGGIRRGERRGGRARAVRAGRESGGHQVVPRVKAKGSHLHI